MVRIDQRELIPGSFGPLGPSLAAAWAQAPFFATHVSRLSPFRIPSRPLGPAFGTDRASCGRLFRSSAHTGVVLMIGLSQLTLSYSLRNHVPLFTFILAERPGEPPLSSPAAASREAFSNPPSRCHPNVPPLTLCPIPCLIGAGPFIRVCHCAAAFDPRCVQVGCASSLAGSSSSSSGPSPSSASSRALPRFGTLRYRAAAPVGCGGNEDTFPK